jgi:hypothetical protein
LRFWHCAVINVIGSRYAAENPQKEGLMMAWKDAYNEVLYRLRKLQQTAPSTLWQNVINEVIKRWENREDIRAGKTHAEVTVKINAINDDVAQKALNRIKQMAEEFGSVEDEGIRVVMLGQIYRKDGNISVLLRLRIVPKTEKTRSKFIVTEDNI